MCPFPGTFTTPGSYIEVSEVDPVVTRAAIEAFGLPKDSSIRRYDMDGRNRVADLIRQKRAGNNVTVSNFIFGDAFSDCSVPYHLTTLEFNNLLDELLTDQGVYMLNLIDLFASGQFLGAVLNTCRQVFPHVYVFSAQDLRSERNTFIVVSAKRPLDSSGFLDTIRSRPGFSGEMLNTEHLARLAKINGDTVLTDDYTPVENLLAEAVRSYTVSRDEEGSYATEIASLFEKGEFDQVVRQCRKVLGRNARAPRIHFMLGSALAKQVKARSGHGGISGRIDHRPFLCDFPRRNWARAGKPWRCGSGGAGVPVGVAHRSARRNLTM